MVESKKYNDILVAVQKLFYKYGLKKVTIEDICIESNVSKMTFYKFFPNKIELAKTFINNLFAYWMDRYVLMMESDISFPEKIKNMLAMKLESSRHASKDFILDLYKNPNHELVQLINEWQQKSINYTVQIFMDAQQKGFIRKSVKPELILILIEKMREIAFDQNLQDTYKNYPDLIMEITKFFLYGVSNER